MFSYAPNGGTGTLYYSNLLAGQTWPAATAMAGSNVYDANSPQVALDASGAALATFDAYQIDSYNNAYATVWGYSGGSYWSGFGVLGSPITRLPALLRFYGTPTTYINNAVVLIPSSCGLVSEVDSSYARFEATVTTDCLSAYDFALNAAGYGVVGYKTTAGAVNAAERFGGASDGVWTAPTPLAAANSLTSQVAVANAPTNEAIVVYTVGKRYSNGAGVAGEPNCERFVASSGDALFHCVQRECGGGHGRERGRDGDLGRQRNARKVRGGRGDAACGRLLRDAGCTHQRRQSVRLRGHRHDRRQPGGCLEQQRKR